MTRRICVSPSCLEECAFPLTCPRGSPLTEARERLLAFSSTRRSDGYPYPGNLRADIALLLSSL